MWDHKKIQLTDSMHGQGYDDSAMIPFGSIDCGMLQMQREQEDPIHLKKCAFYTVYASPATKTEKHYRGTAGRVEFIRINTLTWREYPPSLRR